MGTPSSPVEHVYKVLVVGDVACGKTSFIQQWVNRTFSLKYRATIGVDFALKTIQWDDHTSVRLQLWDIAGQERFGHMSRVYYREAVGVFIVFDVTQPRTFNAVRAWKQDIDENLDQDARQPRMNPDPVTGRAGVPVVILANKIDLATEEVNREQMDTYCAEIGCDGWFAVSAKENIGIDEAGHFLLERILARDPHAAAPPPDVVDLGPRSKAGPRSRSARRAADADGGGSKSSCSC